MSYQVEQHLTNGPIDIIGDVHGEWSSLQNLLRHLGYDEQGRHPESRRLVFVGDMCDRGPDSPAVLEWVRRAHDQGYAQVVLGNHEINILINDPKDGSGWYFPHRAPKDEPNYAPWHTLPESNRADLVKWLNTLPIALSRPDLRIVHAAWQESALTAVRQNAADTLSETYRQYEHLLQQQIQHADWAAEYSREQAQYVDQLEDYRRTPPFLPATAQFELARNSTNPIRLLTCGIEKIVAQPFFAAGRWRFTGRCPWWQNYTDNVPVVIGHYWRTWQPQPTKNGKEILFQENGNEWLGAKRNVFCVDFSVGARWRDRKQTPPTQPNHSRFRLAALRWPERALVFDNGETASTHSFEK